MLLVDANSKINLFISQYIISHYTPTETNTSYVYMMLGSLTIVL